MGEVSLTSQAIAWKLRFSPRAYQSEAADWALARQQAVCSLPTGTGKTPIQTGRGDKED